MKKNKIMNENNNPNNPKNHKGLINPNPVTQSKEQLKKISIGKNDIVERDSKVITDDGRQLLK